MAGITTFRHFFLRKVLPAFNRRLVSTSKKNPTTVTAETCKAEEAKAVSQRNWVSYGFDHYSKAGDRNAMHSVMFTSVTLCITVGGIYLIYLPDYSLRDWSRREAFLELRRREQKGLPLVDPNLIDPAKIVLPSDEELGNTEIII